MKIELSCRVVSSSYVHVAKLLLPVVATTTLALHSFLYRPPAHSWNRIMEQDQSKTATASGLFVPNTQTCILIISPTYHLTLRRGRCCHGPEDNEHVPSTHKYLRKSTLSSFRRRPSGKSSIPRFPFSISSSCSQQSNTCYYRYDWQYHHHSWRWRVSRKEPPTKTMTMRRTSDPSSCSLDLCQEYHLSLYRHRHRWSQWLTW